MYMTALYLGTGNDGFKTGISYSSENDDETKQAFESLRAVEVDIKEAPFLIDLHDDDGVILGSIGISEETYSTVTGQPVFSEDVYQQIDRDYWKAAEKAANQQAE